MQAKRNWWPWVLCLLATGADAAPKRYVASLNGASEAPPNASPATGLAVVTVDATAHSMIVEAAFSGMLGPTTAAHIHCCTTAPGTGTAAVATTTPNFPGFPLGVTSGNYQNTFDLTNASSYNASFVNANGTTPAGAEAALIAGIVAGNAYFNIHSTVFPGGEIRAFLSPDSIFLDGFE